MEYRRLGRSDLTAGSIALGCVTFDREITRQESYAVMDHALERGITLFDTAEAYAEGKSEETVGDWLQRTGNRERVILATKASPPLGKHLVEAAEASLRRLRTGVIDLYQLHAWDPHTPLEETLDALSTLVSQGKVRTIGCSNFTAGQLKAALGLSAANGWPRMETGQPIYNLAVRDIESALLPLCAAEEVGVISYSPLGAGFLTGKYHTTGVAPAGTRFDIKPAHWEVYEGRDSMRRMEGLRAVSEQTGRSMVSLALSWVLGQPGISSVLVGARSTAHIDQAFDAERMGLTPELRRALNDL